MHFSNHVPLAWLPQPLPSATRSSSQKPRNNPPSTEGLAPTCPSDQISALCFCAEPDLTLRLLNCPELSFGLGSPGRHSFPHPTHTQALHSSISGTRAPATSCPQAHPLGQRFSDTAVYKGYQGNAKVIPGPSLPWTCSPVVFSLGWEVEPVINPK